MQFTKSVAHLFDAERTRLPLFIPVAMGFGAAAYYVLLNEPAIWVSIVVLLAVLMGGFALRRYWWMMYVTLFVAMGLFGFSNAALHTKWFGHQVLEEPVFWKQISGIVKGVQLDDGQERVILTDLTIESLPPEKTPDTIRIKFKKQQEADINAGDRLTVRATLFTLPDPVAPNSFDYSRYLYFQGLDAVGYTTAQAEVETRPPNMWHYINRFRLEFAGALLERLSEPEGSVAAALTVGEQQAIPEEVNDALRDSGLYHILSISGVHMSLAAGIIFFAIRALLAMWPYLALHYNIKKIAALLALFSSFLYLLAAGAPVPAVRSFIMVAMVFGAILVDRKAISLYTLAWAAFAILLIQPYAVVSASFQLSFAATGAIVALYERFGGLMASQSDGIIRRFRKAIIATMLVSIVATLATSPFVITHFNRMQWWGVLSNSMVSPLTAFVIMPGVVISFLSWPFGLESFGFWLMEFGIHYMLLLGEWVAGLPYASIYFPSFHPVGFVLAVLGMSVFLLFKTKLRLSGLALIICGMLTMNFYQSPHMFIGERAKQIAVTDAAGNLVMLKGRPNSFVSDGWSRLHGAKKAIPRKQAVWDDNINGGCFKDGCWYTRGEHRFVFVVKPQSTDALCRRTNANILVFNYRLYDGECLSAKTVIDRKRLNAAGSMDIRFDKNNNINMRDANPLRGTRPWVAAP